MRAAIESGDLDYVKAHWNEPFEWNMNEFTPLGLAVRRLQHDIVYWMVVHARADVNECARVEHWRPIKELNLHYDRSGEILSLLLQAGADPNWKRPVPHALTTLEFIAHVGSWHIHAMHTAILFAYGAQSPTDMPPWMQSIYEDVQAHRKKCLQGAIKVLRYVRPKDLARVIAQLIWNERRNV